MSEAVKVEHGIEDGVYANGPWGLKPCLSCLCGFGTDPWQCDSWEEAGRELDEHLASLVEYETAKGIQP